MKTLEYVKEHIDEFEEEDIFDRRFTKRFLYFLPEEEWKQFGFKRIDGKHDEPKEWTEDNILKQLEDDVRFGYEKAIDERGISAELMAMVVRAWCKVLENGLNMDDRWDGSYHILQFTSVAEHYGWHL